MFAVLTCVAAIVFTIGSTFCYRLLRATFEEFNYSWRTVHEYLNKVLSVANKTIRDASKFMYAFYVCLDPLSNGILYVNITGIYHR